MGDRATRLRKLDETEAGRAILRRAFVIADKKG
jgi:hypothetical protein